MAEEKQEQQQGDISKTNIEIKEDKPEKFAIGINEVKDYAERINRRDELTLNNDSGSISLKRNGQINLSSKLDAQIKLSPNGTYENISLNTDIKTVSMKINADDISVNNHKLNNKLYELADYSRVLTTNYSDDVKIAGNLTMLGTVLVKAWDNNLKRYVLIRRLANIPVFSPTMGSIDALPGLQITPSTEMIKKMQEGFNNFSGSMEEYLTKIREEKLIGKEDSSTKNNTASSENNETDTKKEAENNKEKETKKPEDNKPNNSQGQQPEKKKRV